MGSIGLPELIIILVVLCGFAATLVPWFFIFRKSGHSPALALLMFVPLVNVGALFWFAFAEWPIEKELKALRQERR